MTTFQNNHISSSFKFIKVNLLSINIYLGILFFLGCSPKDIVRPTLIVEADNTLSGASPNIISITNAVTYPSVLSDVQFYFDWENLETMPVAEGVSPIPSPWSSQANRAFSEDIRFDIRKEDGWELYTTNFVNANASGIPFLMLYNKYRGILRYYYYIQSGTQGTTDNQIISSRFKVEGSNKYSPLMTFSSQKIINLDNFESYSSSVENQITTDITWYAVEIEVAYDKNIYGQNSNSIALAVKTAAEKLNPLSINNIPSPNLYGKIQVTNLDFTRFGTAWKGNANLVIRGMKDLLNASPVLNNEDYTEIQNILNGFSYHKVFNGNFQEGSIGRQLKWSVDIDYSNFTSGTLIQNVGLCISGADNSDNVGLGNFYNEALGVFYLNQKPVVNYTKRPNESLAHFYELDVSSVEYLFNPALLAQADIVNITQEIIANDAEVLSEDIEKGTFYTAQRLRSNLPISIQGVRVSFDVVPKDGGKKVRIVKTFRATINNL